MLHKRSVCLLESAVFIRRIYKGIFILKSCQLLNICETLNHMGIPSDAQEGRVSPVPASHLEFQGIFGSQAKKC